MLGKKNVKTSIKRSPSHKAIRTTPTNDHKVRNARAARVEQHDKRNNNATRLTENLLRDEKLPTPTEPISL